jgi:hypothetical protein
MMQHKWSLADFLFTTQQYFESVFLPKELSGVHLWLLEEDGYAEVHERLREVDHRLSRHNIFSVANPDFD